MEIGSGSAHLLLGWGRAGSWKELDICQGIKMLSLTSHARSSASSRSRRFRSMSFSIRSRCAARPRWYASCSARCFRSLSVSCSRCTSSRTVSQQALPNELISGRIDTTEKRVSKLVCDCVREFRCLYRRIRGRR